MNVNVATDFQDDSDGSKVSRWLALYEVAVKLAHEQGMDLDSAKKYALLQVNDQYPDSRSTGSNGFKKGSALAEFTGRTYGILFKYYPEINAARRSTNVQEAQEELLSPREGARMVAKDLIETIAKTGKLPNNACGMAMCQYLGFGESTYQATFALLRKDGWKIVKNKHDYFDCTPPDPHTAEKERLKTLRSGIAESYAEIDKILFQMGIK